MVYLAVYNKSTGTWVAGGGSSSSGSSGSSGSSSSGSGGSSKPKTTKTFYQAPDGSRWTTKAGAEARGGVVSTITATYSSGSKLSETSTPVKSSSSGSTSKTSTKKSTKVSDPNKYFKGEVGTAVKDPITGAVKYGGVAGSSNIKQTVSKEKAKLITEQRRKEVQAEKYKPFEENIQTLEVKTPLMAKQPTKQVKQPDQDKYTRLSNLQKTLEQESTTLQSDSEAFRKWQTNLFGEQGELERRKANVDLTSEEEVASFNAYLNQIVAEQKRKKEALDLKLDTYNLKVQEFEGERKSYLTEVEAWNKRVEEQKADYDVIVKKEQDIKNKFFTPITTFEEGIPNTSQVPTTEYKIKPWFQRFGYTKQVKDFEKLQSDYYSKWYPVDLSNIKPLTNDQIKKFSTVDIDFIDTDRAEAIRKEGLSLQNVGEANKLLGQFTAKRGRIQGTTTTPRWESEKKVMNNLMKDTQAFQDKETLKDMGEVAFTTIATAGIGQAIPLLAKTPYAGKVVKAIISPVGRKVAWGVYGATEGMNVVAGAKAIREGRAEEGFEKIKDAGLRGVGVLAGVSWLKGTGGKPFKKINLGTKKVSNTELETLNKWMKPKGIQYDQISKIDRYGNVYNSLEAKPIYAKGQKTIYGGEELDLSKTYYGYKTNYLATPQRGGGITFKGKVIEGQSLFEITRGVRQTGFKVQGVRPDYKKNRFVDIGESLTKSRQTKLFKDRWVALDSKTGKYVEVYEDDILIEGGQVFVKQNGKWRWASELKGWVKTDKSLQALGKQNIKNYFGDIDIKYTSAGQKTLDSYTPKKITKTDTNIIKKLQATKQPYLEQPKKVTTQKSEYIQESKGKGKTKKTQLTDYKLVSVEPQYQYIPTEQPIVISKVLTNTKSFPPILKLEQRQYSVPQSKVKQNNFLETGLKVSPAIKLEQLYKQSNVNILDNLLKVQPVTIQVPEQTERVDFFNYTPPVSIFQPLSLPSLGLPPITPFKSLPTPQFGGGLPRGSSGKSGQRAVNEWLVTNPIRNLWAENSSLSPTSKGTGRNFNQNIQNLISGHGKSNQQLGKMFGSKGKNIKRFL